MEILGNYYNKNWNMGKTMGPRIIRRSFDHLCSNASIYLFLQEQESLILEGSGRPVHVPPLTYHHGLNPWEYLSKYISDMCFPMNTSCYMVSYPSSYHSCRNVYLENGAARCAIPLSERLSACLRRRCCCFGPHCCCECIVYIERHALG